MIYHELDGRHCFTVQNRHDRIKGGGRESIFEATLTDDATLLPSLRT